MEADGISKRALLKAPISRVWRAISNAREFGEWSRVALEPEREFIEGADVRRRMTHPGYEHLTAELFIGRMTAPTYFAYGWHPYAGRHPEAPRMNDLGWTGQLENVEKYVSSS